MKKKLSKNNLKFIILVFIFLIGIGTFLVRESFASMQQQDLLQQDGGGGGSGGGYTPPTPTITVNISSNVSTVPYGGSATVTWSSTGATACTRSDTGASIGTSGSFTTNPLHYNTIITITCTTDSYCSGNYTDTTTKVNWDGSGNTFNWVEGQIYMSVQCGDNCGWQLGEIGHGVEGSSWYSHVCVKNFLCIGGSHWTEGKTYVRSAYAIKSCVGFPQSSCSSTTGCTWHP